MNLRLFDPFGRVIGRLHIDRPLTDRLASDLFRREPALNVIVAQPDGWSGSLRWERPIHCGLAMLRMTA